MTAQMKEKLREQQHVDLAIEATTTLINFYANALEESVDQITFAVNNECYDTALDELARIDETEMVEHLRDLVVRRKELQDRSDSL